MEALNDTTYISHELVIASYITYAKEQQLPFLDI